MLNSSIPVIIMYIKLNLFHFLKIITPTSSKLKGEAHNKFKLYLVPEWSVPHHMNTSKTPKVPVVNKLADVQLLKSFSFLRIQREKVINKLSQA